MFCVSGAALGRRAGFRGKINERLVRGLGFIVSRERLKLSDVVVGM